MGGVLFRCSYVWVVFFIYFWSVFFSGGVISWIPTDVQTIELYQRLWIGSEKY